MHSAYHCASAETVITLVNYSRRLGSQESRQHSARSRRFDPSATRSSAMHRGAGQSILFPRIHPLTGCDSKPLLLPIPGLSNR